MMAAFCEIVLLIEVQKLVVIPRVGNPGLRELGVVPEEHVDPIAAQGAQVVL